MASKPRKDAESIIADARDVLAAAKQHAAKFRAAEKKRKAKLFVGGFDVFVKNLGASAAQVAKAVGGQAGNKSAAKAATGVEEAARAKLFELVTGIRDAIAATPGIAATIAEAFGRSTKVRSHSTPELLAAADLQLASYMISEHHAAAVACGIDAAQIKALSAARDALAAADTAQGAVRTVRKGATKGKVVALKALEKATSQVRRVAKLALRGDKQALAAFARRTAARVTAKRAKTPAVAPAPAPAPAGT